MHILKALFIFIFPSCILRLIRTQGFSLGQHSKIGFSWVSVRNIHIGNNVNIGSGNLIQVEELICGNNVFIGNINIIRGKLLVNLGDNVEIYKQNKISAPMFNVVGTTFTMQDYSRISVNHIFDLTHNVTLGKGTCIAGLGSQFWTHSFYYSQSSYKRIRVDKPISIGDHCYVGSSVVICPGVEICDGVTIGAGTSIAKSISQSGLYVNSSIRKVENFNADQIIENYDKENDKYYTEYEIIHK